MTFTIGLIVGLVIGASIGAVAIALMTAAKVSELQDKVDAFEASRWPS